MDIILGIIIAAIVIWIAIRLLAIGFVILRILFQLCIWPIILGALTWWLWDNAWIGIGIGAAIVIYISIKDGGIGWVFDADSSSGRRSSSRSPISSPSTTSYPVDDYDNVNLARHHSQQAEDYKNNYEYYLRKAKERFQQAQCYESYANDMRNKANLYNDSSYYDQEREYRDKAARENDEAQAFCQEAERFLRLANEEIHAANVAANR